MPRQSIEDLADPAPRYRVDRRTDHPSGFVKLENNESCVRWDRRRLRALVAYSSRRIRGRKRLLRVKHLIRFMTAVLAGSKRRLSAASKVQMRDWRIRVSGWLWSLIDGLNDDEWVFFTVVLPSWWVESRHQGKVGGKSLTERLRLALYRAGSSDASGWLYAMIDIEFDGSTDGFTRHFHGIATGGMIPVLRRLRDQPQFQKNKTDAAKYPLVTIKRKLKIERRREPLPAAITYASKSYQSQHDSVVDDHGERRRVGHKHRIRGLHLVRLLLWQHRNRVKHQVLLVHLSVVKGALVPGKRGTRRRS